MADTFKRLANLVKGMGSDWMSRMEADNPRATVEAAILGTENRFNDLSKRVGALRSQGDRQGRELSKLESEVQSLTTHRDRILDSEPELALQLTETIQGLNGRIETLKQSEVDGSQMLDELKERMAELKIEADKLKNEGDLLTARSIMAQENNAKGDLAGGTATRAYDKALQNIRQQTEAAQERAEKSGPTPGEINRLKAQARLADLKAKRLGKSEGASIQKAPEEDTPSEAVKGDDPMPKREL